jgi:hypothetical protein
MQIVQGTDAGFIKFGSSWSIFTYRNSINVVLNQKQWAEKRLLLQKHNDWKELDIRFQAVSIASLMTQVFAPRCPATFICLLQTGYLLYFRTKTNTNLSFKDAFKNRCLDANQSSNHWRSKEQYIEIINSLLKNNIVNEKSIYFNNVYTAA